MALAITGCVYPRPRQARRDRFGFALVAFVGRTVAWAITIAERRRQRRALVRLDDRLLKDIGLGVEDVRAECRTPFWR